MTQRKKLIEVALPLEAINVASAREKSIRHGHPSTLHLWWARRPLAAARAVIFSSLVDDPDSPDALPAFVEACKQLPIGANVKANGDTPRMRLFDFIERLVTWEATTDEAILSQARELIQIATEGNPPPLLDPFAGGGSIPLEAQRLGLEAHASDLNPVAVMINKAQIEIPPRFANMPPVNPRDSKTGTAGIAQWKGAAGLAADVRYYGEWMREKAWEKIGHLYPTHNGETVIAWLWARTAKCPNPACGAEMPLISSYDLSKKKGKNTWLEPVVDLNNKSVQFTVKSGEGKPSESPKVGRGAKFRCLVCGELAPESHIKEQGMLKQFGVKLLAIVTDGKNGRSYYASDTHHENIAKQADPIWQPETELVNNPRHMSPPLYGLTHHNDLFTPRQLSTLAILCELITEARLKVRDDAVNAGLTNDTLGLEARGNGALAYAEAVCVYLSLIISKQADLGNSLCPWEPVAECPRNLFGRQLVSMTWNFAEGNIMGTRSGSWSVLCSNFERNLNAFTGDLSSLIGGHVEQSDVLSLVSREKYLISTDPPYYDNVPYADLSDFFYVWLRHCLRRMFPEILTTLLVPKEPELVADHQRWGGRENANSRFEKGLNQAFLNIYNLTTIDYPVTVFYAFKQTEDDDDNSNSDNGSASSGWETMLNGLIQAGHSIIGTWPMRTELTKALKTNMNFLASSIVLVCRPRAKDAPSISRRAFVDALRRELPAALKEMQSGNIAPVDLAQASIGPGMAIYSRYSKVLEADGTALSVRTALGLINQELDAYLAEQDGDIDGDTRFAVDWFSQFGFEEGDFGQADVLARAKNTSVSGVEAAGLVIAGRGKVKLKHWTEYDPSGWNPKEDKRATVWEATHHLIERLNTHGETGSAMLMTQLASDMAAEARNLAYRLYSICERKGWADHARDYNALVISWAGIGEETARLREAKSSGDAVEQKRLFED